MQYSPDELYGKIVGMLTDIRECETVDELIALVDLMVLDYAEVYTDQVDEAIKHQMEVLKLRNEGCVRDTQWGYISYRLQEYASYPRPKRFKAGETS